jgi:hypothetical protein
MKMAGRLPEYTNDAASSIIVVLFDFVTYYPSDPRVNLQRPANGLPRAAHSKT